MKKTGLMKRRDYVVISLIDCDKAAGTILGLGKGNAVKMSGVEEVQEWNANVGLNGGLESVGVEAGVGIKYKEGQRSNTIFTGKCGHRLKAPPSYVELLEQYDLIFTKESHIAASSYRSDQLKLRSIGLELREVKTEIMSNEDKIAVEEGIIAKKPELATEGLLKQLEDENIKLNSKFNVLKSNLRKVQVRMRGNEDFTNLMMAAAYIGNYITDAYTGVSKGDMNLLVDKGKIEEDLEASMSIHIKGYDINEEELTIPI